MHFDTSSVIVNVKTLSKFMTALFSFNLDIGFEYSQ